MSSAGRGAVAAACAMVLFSTVGSRALAQSPEPPTPESEPAEEPADEPATDAEPAEKAPKPVKPWSQGVSPEQRTRAQALLDQGNQRFLDKSYAEALALYVEATTHWDHPAIRLNIVRALINLDRPVEAYDNIDKALRYGKEPFSDAIYGEAENYRTLLRGQVADLRVECRQAGARLTLDGEPFLSCPGDKTIRIRPGKHQLVGELSGHLTKTEQVVLTGGQTEAVSFSLVKLSDATVMKRRWQAWKPWAVVGGGAAVTLVGGLLAWQASSDIDEYNGDVTARCPPPLGCSSDERATLEDDRKSAERMATVGAVTLSIGGAALVAGAALLYLNRERPVLVESPEIQTRVTTIVGRDNVGLGISGSF